MHYGKGCENDADRVCLPTPFLLAPFLSPILLLLLLFSPTHRLIKLINCARKRERAREGDINNEIRGSKRKKSQ